jgi:LAO/AO transport system kinase
MATKAASPTKSRRTATATEADPASLLAGMVAGILAGERAILARAITLIESKREDHRHLAHRLVQELLPHSGHAKRVGITGAPGSGKSTTIDALGSYLTARGHRLAVLAVDPSSVRTGGSILGDKTRMAQLGNDPRAFIRPSPTGGTLGGVAARTRETMLICEAAGFDVILVETVGTGQSETTVADMTDFFMVLMLPGAGDELQGLKKGIVELADMVAINKADGDNVQRAKLAAAEYRAALHILTPRLPEWQPPVITYSALTGEGLADLWEHVLDHERRLAATGALKARRREQQVKWMWAMLDDRLRGRLQTDPKLKSKLPQLERAVGEGLLAPALAVDDILAALGLTEIPEQHASE